MQELIKKSKNISYRETLTDKKANIIVNILSNSKSSAYIKSLIGEYKNCNKTEAIAAGFFSCEEIIGKTDAELGWKRSANTLVLNDRIVINGKVPMAVSEKGVFNRKLLEALTKKFPTFDNNNITSILGITNPKYNNESDLIYFHKIVTFIDCVYYGVLTEVDLEIISGIIKSMLQKQIMSELDISQSTITKRIKRILAELNLRKESDLVDLFLHK